MPQNRTVKRLLHAMVFTSALFATTVLPIFSNLPRIFASTDTYPTSISGCRAVSGTPAGYFTCDLKDDTQDTDIDPWAEYNRECVSYVAWMLHSVNGFEMPFNDNAYNWGPRAQALNYSVDMTPQVGSVYWISSGVGHVAWVESVSSDRTQVTVDEYNYNVVGGWDTRTVATSSASGYIHFKDLASGSSTKNLSDINGDGNDDMLLLTHDTDGATGANVGLSTNAGFWMQPEWWHDPYTDWTSMKPLVADVTGDGKADLVYLIPTSTGSQAWVLRSTGTAYQSPQLWWNGTGYQFSGIKAGIGDINGDGKADLILFTHQADGGTAVSADLSTGSAFSLQAPWWTDTYTDWNYIIPLVGDVTGDGVADITYLVPTGSGTNAWVLKSTKTGLQAAQNWWTGNGYLYSGIKAVMGDMDGNGIQDLVLVTHQADGGTAVSPALSTGQGFWLQAPWWTDTYTDWNNMTPMIGNFSGNRYNQHPIADFGYLVPTATGTKAWVLTSTRTGLNAPAGWWSNSWGYAGIKVARDY